MGTNNTDPTLAAQGGLAVENGALLAGTKREGFHPSRKECFSMKTLAIVGAGPGVGLSLAKTFGQCDFRVALIARQREKLDAYVQQVQELHSEAAGFSADVLNAAQLEGALIHVKETYGAC
jgi:NADP-dependent 3-hydroxy acid dehydrogenase YdfG